MRWVTDNIDEPGQDLEWVFASSVPMLEASLSFTSKFWWVMVRSRIQPMHADNTLTLDCMILVASILVGYNINWARLIAK